MIVLNIFLGTALGLVVSMVVSWIIHRYGKSVQISEIKSMHIQSYLGIFGFTVSVICTPFILAYPETGILLPTALASFSSYAILNSLGRAIHLIDQHS